MTLSSRSRRDSEDDLRGREIFEVTPVILGGSPSDPKNKVALTREDHIKAVRYWNGVIASLRNKA